MFRLIKITLFLLFFIFFLGLGIFFWYQYSINTPGKLGDKKVFIISPGEGVNKIAENLYKNKFIDSVQLFKLYIWLNHKQGDLQAGRYNIDGKKSIKDIVSMFSNGQVDKQEKTMKIIEGWNNRELAAYMDKNSLATGTIFLSKINSPLNKWSFSFAQPEFLKNIPSNAGLEGYLFPDTYRIYKDAGIDDIVEKMLNNFSAKLDSRLLKDIKEQGKTLAQVVTMASIIEKEAPAEKDRPVIAGILYKRMKIGMKLEVDSTINYITGKNNPGADYKDLDIDSPYNTYKYYGLPPAPICNPGLSAIKAAVYPKESPYLFYLHRQDTKETIFSKTYEEHLRNKQKYL